MTKLEQKLAFLTRPETRTSQRSTHFFCHERVSLYLSGQEAKKMKMVVRLAKECFEHLPLDSQKQHSS